MKELLTDILGCLSLFALLWLCLFASEAFQPDQIVWEQVQ
jgi:hypothetical protein